MSEEPVEPSPKPELAFAQRRLPWLIAAGALLVYGLTLPRWITFLGLGSVARAAGWDWHPTLLAPLQFLLTYPIRWLPAGLQVVCFNLFAALFSALTLALRAPPLPPLPPPPPPNHPQTYHGHHSPFPIPPPPPP